MDYHASLAMTKNVLGINIDDINQQQALEKVAGFLASQGDALRSKHYIVTPNPEIIVAAQQDSDLQNVLNDADLAIPDGIGLKFAGVRHRVAGIDLMIDLVKLAAEKGYVVGFIGGEEGVAQKCSEVLKKRFPNLKVSFADSGGEIDSNGKSIRYRVEDIKQDRKNSDKQLDTLYTIPYTDILFVAFGHGKQEKWIARYLDKIPVNVAMVVGGSLDYISGEIPRAPKFLRDYGFEWLFRLLIQPWRITRQLALIRFVWLLLTNKSNFKY